LFTIQRFGQYPGNGSFTHSTGTAEDIRVGNTALLYGILQGLHHAFLSDYVIKILRPEFSGKNEIFHFSSL
jgi:hypothetical protein